jgi:hypothetical protein
LERAFGDPEQKAPAFLPRPQVDGNDLNVWRKRFGRHDQQRVNEFVFRQTFAGGTVLRLNYEQLPLLPPLREEDSINL